MISIVAADGVVRERLPDETLLVFLSDTHIGGSSGSDVFESAAELTMLLEDLHHHDGPVELVLAGDFLDLLRVGDAGGGDPVAVTLARPEYRVLFATLRAFAAAEGHRVVYVVGNHDAELWWNPRVRGTLQEAGLVDIVALSYAASFASLPDRLVYCEHGNQFDPASAITDYANPLFVGEDLRGWLLGYGLVALTGVAAWLQRSLRIRQVADEESDIPLALAAGHRYRAVLAVAVTAFGLLGWLLYDVANLGSAELAVAAVALAGVVAIIASSVPMWNQILRYARAGEGPCSPRPGTPGWMGTGSPTRCSGKGRPTWCWPAAAMATSTSPGRIPGSRCSCAGWRRSAG
jgi:UDP-2,3-diacylglucosamine pyrophosphatase LpxH